MFRTINIRALAVAALTTLILVLMIVAGSRNLQNFDAALVGYLFATIFAVFGITYRYAVWLQRPPTRLYWRRGWQLLFSRHLVGGVKAIIRSITTDYIAQRFIARRSWPRWAVHFLLAWGCIIAFAVTFPLVFGWIHFETLPGSPIQYRTFIFGFPAMRFYVQSVLAWNIFHALDWAAVMVVAGVVFAVRRRLVDPGLLATQTFSRDWLPLIILFAVSITGLLLTASAMWMKGAHYSFLALTHEITVIFFLIWLPFGKFFHIFQRPAQLGVSVYKQAGSDLPAARCARCGTEYASTLHVNDLKQVTKELGMDYEYSSNDHHLDLCPACKRARYAESHMQAKRGQAF
ncbi:MAG TPA: MFS transporter [Acidobacteriota bacterium]|jgi:hypothetical protein